MSGAAIAIPLAIEALQALALLEANTPQALALALATADMLRAPSVTAEATADVRRQLAAIRAAIDAA